MPIPKKRLVITKEHGITTENIPFTTEKSAIFTKKGKKIGVMSFLDKKSNLRRTKLTQKQKDRRAHRGFKHHKTAGSSFHFRRIETLVKNKHSQMKHWSLTAQRRKNPKYRQILRKQLKGVPVLLIVRIHRSKNLPPQILNKLKNLRLMRPWDAIIVRNTPGLELVLRDVLPFITFGVPSREIVRDLVMKRGRLINVELGNTEAKHGRSVIKSNVIVEKILGKYGVICIEDLIDVLATDPQAEEDEDEMFEDENGNKMTKPQIFDAVANTINPFTLNTITIPMKGLKTPFNRLGYWGFRGTFINTFVEKIL